MKFIQKQSSKFINFILIIITIYIFYHHITIQYEITQVIENWLKIIIPSISLAYITSSFLYQYPLISLLLYPLLKPILHFENQKACSLFIISIIIGEPSISKLITTARENGEISLQEANRLMRFTCFVSPIFLFKMLGVHLSIVTIIIELITNTIIAHLSKSQSNYSAPIHQSTILDLYLSLINELPKLLLGILSSMIIITIYKQILSAYLISSYLEITSGILTLTVLPNSLTKFILIQLLVSTCGLTIMIQISSIIKKVNISMLNFLKYRVLSAILTFICSLIIYLVIFFL